MKKARIVYNIKKDQFELQTNTGDGWGLETAYTCVAREGRPGETDFIHFSVLGILGRLQCYGYDIDLVVNYEGE